MCSSTYTVHLRHISAAAVDTSLSYRVLKQIIQEAQNQQYEIGTNKMRSGNMMYETYTRFCLYGGLSRSKLGVNNINSTVNDLKASNVTTLKLLD